MVTLERSSTLDSMVEEVRPVIEQHRGRTEAERDVPREVVDAMRQAGVFRVWTPAVLGGFEWRPAQCLELFERLAVIDSAAAWIAGNSVSLIPLGAHRYGAELKRELFANPGAVVAGAGNPPGKVSKVDGGYRITGQWAFESGCQYADWISLFGVLVEEDGPARDVNGQPVMVSGLARRDEVEVLDTWHTLGLRGTGSHDVRVNDLLLPDYRCAVIDMAAPRPEEFAGAAYRMGFVINPMIIGAVATGIARAALADGVELALKKSPAYVTNRMTDRTTVQLNLARARANINAAHAELQAKAEETYEFLLENEALDSEHRIDCLLAGTHAVVMAVEAVDLVHKVAGTTAIRNEAPFERYFRDVHTLSQHAFGSEVRMETAGQIMLGAKVDLLWALA